MSEHASQACDLIIEAGLIVPGVPLGQVLHQHALVIDGGMIVALLPQAEARAAFSAKQTVSRPDSVLIPGLVNAHVHNPMTLLRGIADDLPLMVWLQEHIWPAEGRVISAEFVRDGCRFAIAEMLRGGTTCCNEHYFFPDAQAETYKKYGFRARIGLPVIDFPTAWAKHDDEYFARAAEVQAAWQQDALISMALAPHAPYTVNDANFRRLHELAEQWNVPVHLHLHETADEVSGSLKQYGQRPIARLDALGLLNERLIAVHMTQLEEAEIQLCAERGVSVVHCPESNLKLASGFCSAARLQRAGVNLAIGTDGAASNNDLDMLGETRTAALLAKAVAEDAAALSAAEALHAATLGSARAMGLGEVIGSLEVGKKADIACIALDTLEAQPLYNVISQIVYAIGRHQVSDVWIAGQPKLIHRKLVEMDEAELAANARQWQAKVQG